MVMLRQDSIAQDAIDLNLAKEGYTAYYVDGTNGLDTYPGDSWEQPFKTIQQAIDEAGSWCKAFIKAGTYAENVAITKQGIHLIGEKASTVLIKPATGAGITTTGDNTTIETLTSVGNGATVAQSAIYSSGKHTRIADAIVGNANSGGCGLLISGHYGNCDGVSIDQSNKPARGIYFESYYGKIHNCTIENTSLDGIILAESACYWNKVHDNTIINAGRWGISLFGLGCDYNTIYHNNIVNSTHANACDTTGNSNKWFENFYDDHTTDTNNCGLCDTAYAFTIGYDYQPVSRRNGWNQNSLPVAPTVDVFRKVSKSITLSTAAVPVTENLFTVTGEVECYLMGYVTVGVTSAGVVLLSAGCSGDPIGFMPVVPKGELTVGNVWVDSTGGSVRPSPAARTIGGGDDIQHYISGQPATAGAITYYCWWRPLSSDGNVVPA